MKWSLSEWVKSLSRVRLFATPWTVAFQAPPSMGFSRQEYWSGLPFPSPGDLPDARIEPRSPAFQADALNLWATKKCLNVDNYFIFFQKSVFHSCGNLRQLRILRASHWFRDNTKYLSWVVMIWIYLCSSLLCFPPFLFSYNKSRQEFTLNRRTQTGAYVCMGVPHAGIQSSLFSIDKKVFANFSSDKRWLS